MSKLVGAGLVPARNCDRVDTSSSFRCLVSAGRHKAGPYIFLFLASIAAAADFQISASLDRSQIAHPPKGLDRKTGHIGFAGHNDPVAFRNFYVKRL